MNRKQLAFILVALLVLGGLGWWMRTRNVASFEQSSGRMGQKVLGEFDPNAVAQIVLKAKTNELHLVKQAERWTVQERSHYPANFSQIGDFVRKLWDLKVIQPVEIGPSQLARLELADPGPGDKTGTLVELKDGAGKTLRSILLGKKHTRQPSSPSPFGGDEGWPDGRYLMVDGKAESVSLVKEAFSDAEPKPEQWLNKDFFKVEKSKTVSLAYPVATNSWKLTRDTESGEFKLADAQADEHLDSSKVSGMASALSWPSFDDVVVDPKPETTGLDHPTVATLETFEGFTYTVRVGQKTPEDKYYMAVAVKADLPKERTAGADEKPEDKEKLDKEFKEKHDKLAAKLKQESALEPWTFLVTKWTLDSILKTRHELLAEKKDEAKPAAEDAASSTPAAPVSPAPALIPPEVLLPGAPPRTSDLLQTATNKVLEVLELTAPAAATLSNAVSAMTNKVVELPPTPPAVPAPDAKPAP